MIRNLLIAFLFFTGALTAQEPPVVSAQQPVGTVEEVPSPSSLPPNWWNYFHVDKGEQIERIEKFNASLDELLEKTEISQQEQLAALIEKVQNNLKAYLHALQQEVPPLTPPATYKPAYTIQNLIDLQRRVRSQELIEQTDRDELEERQERIRRNRAHLADLFSDYQALEDRTEAKLLAGLKIIAYQSSLAISQEQIRYLKETIVNDNELLERLEEEKTVALQNLQVDPTILSRLEEKKKNAQEEWENAVSALRDEEARVLSVMNYEVEKRDDKLRNQLLETQMLEAAIEAATKRNSYLLATSSLLFGQYLSSVSQDTEMERIRSEVKTVLGSLKEIEEQTKDWRLLLQRDLQRGDEALTALVKDPETSRATEDLQRSLLREYQTRLQEVQNLSSSLKDTRFLLNTLSRRLSLTAGGLAWFSTFFDYVGETFQTTGKLLRFKLFWIGETPVTPLSLLRFTLILVATFWFSRFVLLALAKITAQRKGIKKSLLYRINRLINYAILTIGFLIALSSLGFDFSNFLVIAGALGVGLGFGLQSIFNNFISGIIILFESQLKVGDFIELESGIRGEVKEISVRSTHILTNNGISIIIPNSEFINARVINWTLKERYRRLRIRFNVAYGSNMDEVEEVVIEAAKQVPKTLTRAGTPEPRVYIEELGENGIHLVLSIWIDEAATKRRFSTNAAYLRAIYDTLNEHNIEIPFPQRDLHVKELPKTRK